MSLLIFQARLRLFRNGWMLFQTQWAVILAQNFHQNDVTCSHWYPYTYTNLSNVILKLICLEIVNLSFSTHKPKMFVSRKISGSSTAIACWSVVTLKGLNFQAEKSKNLKLFSPPTWLSLCYFDFKFVATTFAHSLLDGIYFEATAKEWIS